MVFGWLRCLAWCCVVWKRCVWMSNSVEGRVRLDSLDRSYRLLVRREDILHAIRGLPELGRSRSGIEVGLTTDTEVHSFHSLYLSPTKVSPTRLSFPDPRNLKRLEQWNEEGRTFTMKTQNALHGDSCLPNTRTQTENAMPASSLPNEADAENKVHLRESQRCLSPTQRTLFCEHTTISRVDWCRRRSILEYNTDWCTFSLSSARYASNFPPSILRGRKRHRILRLEPLAIEGVDEPVVQFCHSPLACILQISRCL
jgi:hypothetical protein